MSGRCSETEPPGKRTGAKDSGSGCAHGQPEEREMANELTQSDLEQLSAYLDGELEAEQARQVEAMLAGDGRWQRAARELKALDETLDQWTAPPAPAGLAERIIAASRQEKQAPALVIRLVKYLTPVAAAAAVAVAYLAFFNHPQTNTPATETPIVSAADKAAVDGLVVEHLDFFKQYRSLETISHNDTVVDEATLKAIDHIEQTQGT
jgi:anti-sigma-K factor RskA